MLYSRRPRTPLVVLLGAAFGCIIWAAVHWTPLLTLNGECGLVPFRNATTTVILMKCIGGAPGGEASVVLAMLRSLESIVMLFTLGTLLSGAKLVLRNFPTFASSTLPPVPVLTLQYASRLTTFTTLSWTLLAAYVVGATACSWALVFDCSVPNTPFMSAVLHLIFAAFQVSPAVALLITSVVTFVLLPMATSAQAPGAKLVALWSWRGQVLHNVNVIIVVNELLYGALPLHTNYISMPMLWSASYVLFAWWWLRRVGVIYYPFLDPTLKPRLSLVVYTSLLVTVAAIHCGIVYVTSISKSWEGSIYQALKVMLYYGAALCIMTVRPKKALRYHREQHRGGGGDSHT